jgi:polar amino acid transport system substrate-binding protein
MGWFRPRGMGPLIVAVLLGTTVCSEGPRPSEGPTEKPATGVCASYDLRLDDALAHICSHGQIRVATDPSARPRSWYDERKGDWRGFDVDVATEVAARLGVTPAFQRRDSSTDQGGCWGDRYDMAVASITIAPDEEGELAFTPPYVYTPGSVVVHTGNSTVHDLATDLDGKRICVADPGPNTKYLEHQLKLAASAPPFEYVVDGAQIVGEPDDESALVGVAAGDGVRCDAALVALQNADAFIDAGGQVKTVGDPLFYEPIGIGFDERDPVDNASLLQAVSKIVDDMRDDDTLSGLSTRDLGIDLTVTAPTPEEG